MNPVTQCKRLWFLGNAARKQLSSVTQSSYAPFLKLEVEVSLCDTFCALDDFLMFSGGTEKERWPAMG